MRFLQLARWSQVMPRFRNVLRLQNVLCLQNVWQNVWRDRRAVTSIEYVIIAIIIAVSILGGLSKVGGYLSTDFNNVSVEL